MLSSAWAGTGRVLQEVTSSPRPPWGRVSAGSGDTREKAFENGAHPAGGQRRKTRGRGAPPGSFVLRWEERFDPVQSIHPWKSQKANNRRQTHTDTYTHAQTQTHTHAHTDAHRHTRAQTCADAHTQDGKRPQASLPYCRGGGWAAGPAAPGRHQVAGVRPRGTLGLFSPEGWRSSRPVYNARWPQELHRKLGAAEREADTLGGQGRLPGK